MSLVDEFCDFYHPYHGISADRRVMQRRVLEQFVATLDGGPQTMTADDLSRFLAQRSDAAAPTTVRKELSAITPFIGWLWTTRRIDAERKMELDEVKPPRGSSGAGLPKPYKAKDMKRFWRELDYAYPWSRHTHRGSDGPHESALFYVERWQRGASGWGRVQAYAKRLQVEAIVSLALYGGVRREEIFRLQLEDMHPDGEYVVVRSAAKNPDAEVRERAVPFVAPMRDAVRAWLDFRKLVLVDAGADHDSVWLCLHQQHRHKPMWFSTFSLLLSKTGRGWEYHRFRHTFATERLRAGLPIEKLQRILGHARISQTLVYAQLLTGDIVDASARSEARFVQTMTAHREAA